MNVHMLDIMYDIHSIHCQVLLFPLRTNTLVSHLHITGSKRKSQKLIFICRHFPLS